MGTKYRRIQVTLDPEFDHALVDLARLTGRPQATIVREWMREAAPVMVEMAEALRVVQDSPKRAVQRMVRVSDRAVVELQQTVLPFRRKPGRPRKRG